MTLSKDLIIVDSSVVECCICFNSNFSKSYSCDYCDFWTCEGCILSSTKLCPKCKRQWPKNPRRNYTVEKFIEESQQLCRNFSDGCNQIFTSKEGLKKKQHEEICPQRKVPCPLSKILGCSIETSLIAADIEKHFEEHHRLDSVYLHDQERETGFFRMTMMSPLPKGTETSCLLLKQEGNTIVFVSTGEGVFRSFLFLFLTPPPKKYQIRVYGTSSAMIKINDRPQVWADVCDTLPLVSFTISQQQYLKWSHASANRSFCIHLKAVEDEEDEDEDDEDDDEDDEDEDEDDEDDDKSDSNEESNPKEIDRGRSLNNSGGFTSKEFSASGGITNNNGGNSEENKRFLKKLKVK